jgi:hypothetical protein
MGIQKILEYLKIEAWQPILVASFFAINRLKSPQTCYKASSVVEDDFLTAASGFLRSLDLEEERAHHVAG